MSRARREPRARRDHRTPAGTPARLHLDPTVLVAGLSLLGLGLVMVTSASISIAERDLGAPFYYLQRQGVFALMGLVGAVFMVAMPMDWWRRASFPALALALTLLVLVLVPGIGHEVNGSTRWLRLGPVGIQVSEAARFLLLIYLAGYLVRHEAQIRERFSAFARPLLLVGAAAILLLAEPDFGAVVVLVGMVFGVMFLGGVRKTHLAAVLLPAAAVLAGLAATSPYRIARMTGFLDPWADPFDSGFQLTQSLIAIGRGEWFGVGLGASVQKLFYLPEAHTDFVFAVLAEELGLIGVAVVLMLFGLIVWRALDIGRRAAAAGLRFHAHVANGVGVWFGLQTAVNIGVNTGLLPTKGLTLPLVSYGGSSLLVAMGALAMLLRIHHETARIERGIRPPREVRT